MSDRYEMAPITRVLLDREGMAAALSVSTDLLDLGRKMGLPCIVFPGSKKTLFDPADVLAWLKAHGRPQDDAESLAAAKARADVVFGKRTGRTPNRK
ncbi:MAG: hypothetical protein IT364_24605 [Candidatus Hydrogenedentes bacterium]|nr:hypothetical protein [Candidatus Hydrogenedentota bacterium]